MSPPHQAYSLRVQCEFDEEQIQLQWFGASALQPLGARKFALAKSHAVHGLPAAFDVGLRPLLADVAAGFVDSATGLQAAHEFLLLREVLAPADLADLMDALYTFLWREARQALQWGGVQKSLAHPAWADPDQRLLRVWFATHRQASSQVDGAWAFEGGASAEQLSYGVCQVFIPKSHKPGSTGTPWWRRWIRLEADDSLQLRSVQGLPADAFWGGMADKMQHWWPAGQRNLFVLLHGYNVSFAEAAVRAAQIAYDLKVPGEMAFYSWPSQGTPAAYAADAATIGASVAHIAQFLHELCERSGAERIHLFVHSMGNRGFLRALERLVADGRPALRLGHVFFCAPDEDVRTFKDVLSRYPHRCEQRSLLVSPEDKAVLASQILHQFDRVGYAPPVTVVPGMDTVVVKGFGLLDWGHGYFASAAPVIEDMREAIETRRAAGERSVPRPEADHFVIDVGQG